MLTVLRFANLKATSRVEFQHVPRNNNVAADVLSKLGSR
jgi:hypothetical protein